jgi:uncharacterized membrane protein
MADQGRLTDPKKASETAQEREVVPEVVNDDVPDIAESLEALLTKLGVSEDDPDARILIERVSASSQYRGPIPPPQMLAEYEKVIPGLGGRIIENWEQQRKHRERLEADTTRGSEARMDRSQRNALIVAVLGLVIAAVLGYFGASTVAIFIAIVAVGGPNAATILSRFIKTSDS